MQEKKWFTWKTIVVCLVATIVMCGLMYVCGLMYDPIAARLKCYGIITAITFPVSLLFYYMAWNANAIMDAMDAAAEGINAKTSE